MSFHKVMVKKMMMKKQKLLEALDVEPWTALILVLGVAMAKKIIRTRFRSYNRTIGPD